MPCGRCMACRIAKSREWTARLLHEMESHNVSSFVTLTYAEDYLPVSGDLVKAHLQGYFKRLRSALSKGRKIKYYACGEYGTKRGRPHYHAIIFGLGPDDKMLIEEAWPNGLVHIGTVTRYSAQYVAGYIMDKYGSKNLVGDHKVKPFLLCSKGIGRVWMEENKVALVRDMSITLEGRRQSLPRYYRKKLEGEWSEDDLEQAMRARAADKRAALEARGVDEIGEADYRRGQREQRAAELRWLRERASRQRRI